MIQKIQTAFFALLFTVTISNFMILKADAKTEATNSSCSEADCMGKVEADCIGNCYWAGTDRCVCG